MSYEDLTPELKAKVMTCKTPEELPSCQRKGYELSNEELAIISGSSSYWGKSHADICSSHGCRGHYCDSLHCAQVGLPLPRCGTFEYDYAG